MTARKSHTYKLLPQAIMSPTAPKTPHRLYQYQKLNDQYLNNLRAGILYFASPLGFNDPYDCSVSLQIEPMTDAEAESYRSAAIAEPGIGCGDELRMMDLLTLKEKIQASCQVNIDEAIDRFRKTGGVTCLSETHDNLLMWSHYAGNGTGICLEFDTQFEPFAAPDIKVQQVQYETEMPTLRPLELLARLPELPFVQMLYCTKPFEWCYEREWRCLHKVAGTAFRYPACALTRVYFGSECCSDGKQKIMDALTDNKQVTFLAGRKSKLKFLLEFDVIK